MHELESEYQDELLELYGETETEREREREREIERETERERVEVEHKSEIDRLVALHGTVTRDLNTQLETERNKTAELLARLDALSLAEGHSV
ncbi:hypothetical protein KIPB_013490 [Kipferlia bialata]|uniref:Uncharacterized protein n=1 Tax=Kipferlia bialata TaxID=797122 RepID=A0A9K3GPK9_9EUKA|nr:hypothetical protein KIPB_013490 [Kipferlia bialata]|eukprot:g13490.t1